MVQIRRFSSSRETKYERVRAKMEANKMNRVLSTLLILSILSFSACIGVTRLPERDRKPRIIRGLPVKAGREAKSLRSHADNCLISAGTRVGGLNELEISYCIGFGWIP